MAQIDILRDVLSYSLRKFEHCIIGSNVYFIFNNERYAIGKLRKVETRNEYSGVTIVYISKLFGKIDECDIFFKDVFIDQKRATINVNITSDEYEWFESRYPSNRDLNRLAQHVERYINIIGDFGEDTFDYANVSALAAHAAISGFVSQQGREERNDALSFDSNLLIDNASYTEETDEAEDDAYPLTGEYDEKDQEEVTPPIEGESEDSPDPEESSEAEEPAEDESADESLEDVQESGLENIEPEAPAFDAAPPIHESRKGIFGFFKGKDFSETDEVKKEVEKAPDISPSAPEETPCKPAMTWAVGVSDNISAGLYEIEKNNYRLEITGKGSMKDFKVVPWEKYKEYISEVHIEDGILNIGNKAFKSFSHLKKVDIPDSVQIIGMSAFEFCEQLSEVGWPSSLKVIGHFAFAGTQGLKEVVLPDSVKEIKDYAFDISDDFSISCKSPASLILGDGISPSDFKSLEPVKRPSEDMYI